MIEKSFDNLKNELDMKRLYIHSEEGAEGKLFAAFIGLVIRSQMQKQLKELMDEKQMTLRKVLRELDKVKQIISADAVTGAVESRLCQVKCVNKKIAVSFTMRFFLPEGGHSPDRKDRILWPFLHQ